MFLPFLFSLLLTLLPVSLSLPTTPLTIPLTTQTWTVTRLDYHFMSVYPGIGPPHTPWPDDKKFKTMLSLEVRIPDAKAASGAWNLTCSAEWEHGVLPGGQVACEGEEGRGEDVLFGVKPYSIPGKDVQPGTPAEMPFTLGVRRKSRLADGLDWFGEVAITCNDHESPTSYLTCMSGPPFDGMRCGLHGIYNIDLGNKKELRIVAESSCPASKTC